ncbi:MAG: FecR domain-containing protein [Gallionella sp.]
MKNLFVLLAALLVCHAAYPAELFGTVDAISGIGFVSDSSGKTASMTKGQKIYVGQTIDTAADSEVHLVTEDGGIVALRPNTRFRVDAYQAAGESTDKIFMSLFKGAIRSITGWIGKHDTSAYRITTPTATIGIRGTDHETTVIENGGGDQPGTYDTVNEGSTILKTPQGETEVMPGKFAFAPRGRAAAPYLLTKQPDFWARRRLRIEGRIQQRKAYYHHRLERMREERIRQVKSVRANQYNRVGNRHGNERYRDHHGQAEAKHSELRERRLEQTRRHRESLRE